MKTLRLALFLALALLPSARAEEAGFFRVTGPVATKITGISADGMVTWTNAATNATFTVQRAVALPGVTNWNDFVQVPVTNETTRHWLFDPKPPADMVLIPAGNFTMGDTFNEGNSDELPTHTVYVSAVYMDKYEVTKAKWDEVYQWAITNGYSFENAGLGKAANHPVQSVSWYDVVKWCNARSELEGEIPAYYTDAAQRNIYRSGETNVENSWVKWTAGYRLPTEAEWEKAARGGLNGKRFPWGDTVAHNLDNYHSRTNYTYDTSATRGYHPSYNDGIFPYTSPAGSFVANGYGLYDMAGNVWELCWDWHSNSYYGTSPMNDARGPASGVDRVGRGGSYNYSAQASRTANRTLIKPRIQYDFVGFRTVLPPGQ